MKTSSTKLNEAIDNYVRSVRILLATVVCMPALFLLGVYAPFVLYVIFFVPLTFTVFFLIVVENEKMKDIVEWGNWMDSKLASEKYLNALLYLHHRQMDCTIDPTSPHYFYTKEYEIMISSELEFKTFLKEKYQYKHI